MTKYNSQFSTLTLLHLSAAFDPTDHSLFLETLFTWLLGLHTFSVSLLPHWLPLLSLFCWLPIFSLTSWCWKVPRQDPQPSSLFCLYSLPWWPHRVVRLYLNTTWVPVTQHVQNWAPDVPPQNLLHPQPSPSQLRITPTCPLLKPKHLAPSLIPFYLTSHIQSIRKSVHSALKKHLRSCFSPLCSYHFGLSNISHPLSPGLLQILLTGFSASTPTTLYRYSPSCIRMPLGK